MIQQKEINAITEKAQVRDTQVERDYIISWILYGIAKNPFLKKNLVFKGGTALKKTYFPDYRFSEDLRFTFQGEFDSEAVKAAFSEMASTVHEASRITLTPKYGPKNENGNFNFHISYVGPLGGTVKDIKVELSKDELICHTPEEREVLNTYSDLINEKYSVLCYTLDEIAAEKMRSLMQRSAPRDLYDVWYLFEMSGNAIEDCIFAFQDKCNFKKVDHKKFIQIVTGKEEKFAKQWKDQLSHQRAALPEFKKVWREMEKNWRRFEKFG